MTIGFKPCGICGATVPDEPNELDALRAEVERLLAHRELCTENLLKGYETGKAEERAAVVAWLRERQEAAEWALTAAGYEHAADAIDRGEHRRGDKP